MLQASCSLDEISQIMGFIPLWLSTFFQFESDLIEFDRVFLVILLLTFCDKDLSIPASASRPISLKNFRSVFWNDKQRKY